MADEVIKEQKKYQNLYARYQEMGDYLNSLLDDDKRNRTDIYYMNEFIRYKNLEAEFLDFRKNAHEVYEEGQPFPYLSL